jgi:hypothetical protein
MEVRVIDRAPHIYGLSNVDSGRGVGFRCVDCGKLFSRWYKDARPGGLCFVCTLDRARAVPRLADAVRQLMLEKR